MTGHTSMTAGLSGEESGDGSGEMIGDTSFKRSVMSPTISPYSCIISVLSCLRSLFTIMTVCLRILTCSDKSSLKKEETESESLSSDALSLSLKFKLEQSGKTVVYELQDDITRL